MLDDVRRVACVGAGTIGGSWALVFTRAGIETRVYDADPRQRESLGERFARGTALLQEGGAIGAREAEAMTARLILGDDLPWLLEGVAYVQESVPERLELKRGVLAELDSLTAPDVVLGSSVSAIPMTQIAEGLRHPERCVTVHPTNPPHLVPLVEIVPGEQTSPDVADAAFAFMERLGQKPIMCRKEIVGYVLNRIQMALFREALYLFREGVASAADIDRCLSEGLGLRWAFLGPFGVEHTNAESIDHDLRKFAAPMRELFRDLCRPYDGPTEDDVRRITAAVEEMFAGRSHEELVAYRDRMVLAVRALKESYEKEREL